MSQEELVSAYVEGEISRRTLIRRLVAGGVSIAAAGAYAQLLTPKAGAAEESKGPVNYPATFVTIKKQDLGTVVAEKELKIRVRTVDYNELSVIVFLEKEELGRHRLFFGEAGHQDAAVQLDKIGPIRNLDKALLKAIVYHRRAQFPPPIELNRDTRLLKRGGKHG